MPDLFFSHPATYRAFPLHLPSEQAALPVAVDDVAMLAGAGATETGAPRTSLPSPPLFSVLSVSLRREDENLNKQESCTLYIFTQQIILIVA